MLAQKLFLCLVPQPNFPQVPFSFSTQHAHWTQEKCPVEDPFGSSGLLAPLLILPHPLNFQWERTHHRKQLS